MSEIVYSEQGWTFRRFLESGGQGCRDVLKILLEDQPEIFSEKYDKPPKDPNETVSLARCRDENDPYKGLVIMDSMKLTRAEAIRRSGAHDKQYSNLRRIFEDAAAFNRLGHSDEFMVVVEHGYGDGRWYGTAVIQRANYGWRLAGKRAGLAGERSGLFMEQIRIVKEMREHDKANGRADEFIRPRWMVWENVPGALSSNGGEDFRAVLEETARIVDKDAVIPRPAKGKWSYSGCIMGDGWSIAWRIHDAQFWGVPQRRKRIALVADFAGAGAPEVLFVRKGMSGDSE